jgi:hypothetical protein
LTSNTRHIRSTLISASFPLGATMPALAMTALSGPALVAASNMPSTSASTAMLPLSAKAAAAFGDRLDDGVSRFRVLAIVDIGSPTISAGEQGAGAADAARGTGDKEGYGGHV